MFICTPCHDMGQFGGMTWDNEMTRIHEHGEHVHDDASVVHHDASVSPPMDCITMIP